MEPHEILFRGKEIDNGEWTTGYYIRIVRKNSTKEIIRHCIFTGVEFWNNLSGETALERYEVVPSALGRYTGLTDKKGTKIFEGDIVEGKEKMAYVVEYDSDISSYVAKAISSSVKMLPCMNVGTMKYYEVIGNIHDNPNLLERGDI